MVMSHLLVFGGASAVMEQSLRVLGEVVSGPARGRPVVLHLDSTLPVDVQRAVTGVEAVRDAPHITLSLDHSHV